MAASTCIKSREDFLLSNNFKIKSRENISTIKQTLINVIKEVLMRLYCFNEKKSEIKIFFLYLFNKLKRSVFLEMNKVIMVAVAEHSVWKQ